VSDFRKLRQLVQKVQAQKGLSSETEAFLHLCLMHLNLTGDAIAASITRGEPDAGIDAIAFRDDGPHFVFCDYTESWLGSLLPIPKPRLEQFIEAWLAIVSSQEDTLTVNEKLRSKIDALKEYWTGFDGYIPHTFHFFTNRKRSGIRRAATEHRMNHYMDFTYFYYQQSDLVNAFLKVT
jgi:hypothetical protein